MGDYTTNFTSNSRISDCAGSWQGACDADIADWDPSNKFIIALLAQCTSHTCDPVTMRLQWRDVTDAGAWTDLGTTGEMKQGSTCTDPGDSGCQTVSESAHVEGGNQFAFASRAKDDYIELRVTVDPADGDVGHEYEFRLWDVTQGAALDLAGYATITLAGAQVFNRYVDVGVSVAESLTRQATFGRSVDVGVGVDETEAHPLTLERALAEAITVAESAIKTLVFEKYVSVGIGVAESLTRTLVLEREVSEPVTVAESVARSLALARAVAATIGVGASPVYSFVYERDVSVGISVTETVDLQKTLTRAISEAVGVAESVGKSVVLVRSLSVDIGVAETATKTKVFSRYVSVPVGVVVTVTKTVEEGAVVFVDFLYGRHAGI